ncbi:thioredoxin-dependent thiol peroxidase [Candidatus Woesearchaeota archaeon]|nr:thioredoxin-dependent thiol peroxidase [Candidatus Woesearchaeota archaeon]
MLKIGDKAPEFELKDSNGQTVKLKDFLGKKIVLYFYPKDDTPGCTLEACSFRDNYSEYTKRKIAVLGISKDNEKSHKKFMEKYQLPFTLLIDDKDVSEKYDSFGKKKFMGREYMGILRKTFLIDEKGKIINIIDEVNTKTHGKDVLKLF